MPLDGGEMKQISNSQTDIIAYQISPNGKSIAYRTKNSLSERQKELNKRGYGFIFYEENIHNVGLYVANIIEGKSKNIRQIKLDGHVTGFKFSNNSKQILAGVCPKNLVDHKYMFTKVFLIDVATGSSKKVSKNEGKLGNYEISPDGKHLIYTAALDLSDAAVSQVFIVNLLNGSMKNLTPENFKGHVTWAAFKNNNEIYYLSGEGVYTNLNEVSVNGGKRKIVFDGKTNNMALKSLVFSDEGKQFVMSISKVDDRINLYTWNGKGPIERITNINPILTKRKLAKQEPFQFKARDGQEVEGLIIYPIDYDASKKHPMIMYIHGGPESHHHNAWNDRYSTPSQVMAGKGYIVAYLNYRSSTGYGVAYSKQGLGDPAGKEFDDIADAIDYLCDQKGGDKNRVGIAGGSYGGYASAWFATYYTEKVRAACMFVGISNLISKRGTTDIPYEEMYVHSGKPLEEQWQMNLKRSPVYYAHQSKTATLIYAGADDPRVHPTQSMELYRRMKVNDHPAVRLVLYPGEGHGNRKQVGQIDVLNRQIQWFDWYVKDAKPLSGGMPPLDISDSYGLDW
jgi:dipeptidyl aminopeptidase/acylaminoacyl peptidase